MTEQTLSDHQRLLLVELVLARVIDCKRKPEGKTDYTDLIDILVKLEGVDTRVIVRRGG